VQFASQPSCSTRKAKRAADPEEEDEDQQLCTLPEPHDHIFFVPNAYAGKECICPFTGISFLAPAELKSAAHLADDDGEVVDLSHHCDRVSVQCAGVGQTTTSPDSCLATAPLPQLDDGEQHKARIVLERNRFHDPIAAALGATADDGRSAAAPSHRLLVYVDDMQAALINLEMDLGQIFSQLHQWDGKLLAGFTSGTGKSYGSHAIESWDLWEAIDKHQAPATAEGTSWWQSMLGR